MSNEKVKPYRGFTEDGKYYIKDSIYEILEVEPELINKWEKQINQLKNKEIAADKGLELEKIISDEILTKSLKGIEIDKLHPTVKAGIAGEVFIFLGVRIPKDELELLRIRSTSENPTTKSEKS